MQYLSLKSIDPNDTGWDQSIHTSPKPGDVEIQPGIYVPASVVPLVPTAQKPLITKTGTGASSSPGSDNTIYYIAGAAILLFLLVK